VACITIVPSKTALSVRFTDTETSYNPSGTNVKPAATWVIELSNNQWRWVSVNGMPMAEVGVNKEHKDWILPLRTTDEAYVLMENDDHTSQNYHYTSPPLIINRITGALIGAQTVYDNTTHWNQTTESKGHCTPIHIGARL
jgi:hypothetical protein